MINAPFVKVSIYYKKNSSMISRLLNEACETVLIKIIDDTSTSMRNRQYVPYWV